MRATFFQFFLNVFFISLVFIGNVFAENLRIVEVVDGDTLLIDIDGMQSYVALYGIDAPEFGQPFADEAKKFVENIIGTTKYKVTIIKTDDNFHKSCEINYVDSNGSNKNLACMVAISGLAFFDNRLDAKRGDVAKFMSSEKMARHRKSGIWSHGQISYPWDYRKQHSITEHEVMDAKEKTNKIFSNVRGSEAGNSPSVEQGSGAATDIKLLNLEKERLLRQQAKMRECDTSSFKSTDVNSIKQKRKYCEDQIDMIDKSLSELSRDRDLYFYEKAERDSKRPIVVPVLVQ